MSENTTSDNKKKIDHSMIIAVCSIITSICALTVSVRQTTIMETQQHSSVWPYLEWLPSFTGKEFYISVENKGIGPAIVTDVKIKIGRELISGDNMMMPLFKLIDAPDTIQAYYSTLNRRVIKPGEAVRIINIIHPKFGYRASQALNNDSISVEILYKSIYGEFWVCRGTVVEKLEKCK